MSAGLKVTVFQMSAQKWVSNERRDTEGTHSEKYGRYMIMISISRWSILHGNLFMP